MSERMYCPPWQSRVYEVNGRTYRYDRTETVHDNDVETMLGLGWLPASARTMMRPPAFCYSTQARTKSYFARDGEQRAQPEDIPQLLREGWNFANEVKET